MRSDMDNSFTCKLHHACLYSPAAEYYRPLTGTHFTVPLRVAGWIDLGKNVVCRFVCQSVCRYVT